MKRYRANIRRGDSFRGVPHSNLLQTREFWTLRGARRWVEQEKTDRFLKFIRDVGFNDPALWWEIKRRTKDSGLVKFDYVECGGDDFYMVDRRREQLGIKNVF